MKGNFYIHWLQTDRLTNLSLRVTARRQKSTNFVQTADTTLFPLFIVFYYFLEIEWPLISLKKIRKKKHFKTMDLQLN